MQNKIYKTSIIISLLIFLAGCKKDIDVLATAQNGSTPATGFGISNLDAMVLSIDASTTEVDTALLVFNNAKYGAETKVTIVVDTSLVNSYNNAKGSSFDYMPADVFTFPATVSIPANSLQGSGKVAINISKLLTYGTSFATGFTITAVSGGSGQILTMHNHVTLVVQVKNQYDGEYTVTGSMVDYANGTLTGPYPWDVYLITKSATQAQLFDNDYTGGIYHKILSNGADSYYGAFGLQFNFDVNGNVTSVVNVYGQPSSNGRSATLDPSGINKFDPATKTLDVKYWMDQPSVITPHRVSFTEHFEYVGPRP
ncbi:MAG TPA: DUF1735 domain-containing protein [Puia sp.]|uniref:DUF1735 domain-containing protein n=1 Tax=Puia sp. TaxID=2045100 RepID=UPI002C4553AB|nr:DUF1735 domain-containing protein [Puia sp.]HVU93812.1 DUF1735 domain-containing protein [Puia sp.]